MFDASDSGTIRFAVAAAPILFFVLIWMGAIAFLQARQKRSVVYLACVTIFFIYVYKVLDYTLFQYQSLLVLKHFMPNLMLNGVAAGDSINLVPLLTLTIHHTRTSLLNVLMMVPFGFGLPFISRWSAPRIVLAGALFSIAIEILQLITGLIAGVTFRIADINDVIFNTVGVVTGYALFSTLTRIYRPIHDWKMAQGSPVAARSVDGIS